MFLPRIDEKKCKQSGECLDVCPVDVFEIQDGVMVVAAPADCIGCEACIAACPEEAITLDEI
jgi:NAD-dependent dihydropyrimidine dehydrogenase PreA subunit